MNLRWKKLSEKHIRLNRYRAMHRKRFRLPSGRQADFYTWDSPAVVGALVVTKENRIVLAKQYRAGAENIHWENPSGIIDKGETPRQAIIRETLEETGYRGKVRYLGNAWPDAYSNQRRYHFLITDAIKVAEPQYDLNEAIQSHGDSRKISSAHERWTDD